MTNDGRNMLFYAVVYENREMINSLLKLGADPSPQKSDYNAALLSLRIRYWDLFPLLSTHIKKTSRPLTDDLIKQWVRGIVPKKISLELNKLSVDSIKTIKKQLNYYLYNLDQERKLPIDKLFSNHFNDYIEKAALLSGYKKLKDVHTDAKQPALLKLDKAGSRVEEKNLGRIRTLYFSKTPSWLGKRLPVEYNFLEDMRYLWERDKKYYPGPQSSAVRYFTNDNRQKIFEFYTNSNPAHSPEEEKSQISALDIKNGWLKVHLKDKSFRWIHISQVHVNSNSVYEHFSTLKLVLNGKVKCNVHNKILVQGGELYIGNSSSQKSYLTARLSSMDTGAAESVPDRFLSFDKKGNILIRLEGRYCSANKLYFLYRDQDHEDGSVEFQIE